MKQQLLRAASTCALIAAMTGAAFAQGSGGTSGGASPGGGSASSPSQAEQMKQKPGSGGEMRSRDSGNAGETVQPKRGDSAEGQAEGKDGKAGSKKLSDDKSSLRSEKRSEARDERQSPRASSDGKRDDQRRASDRGQADRSKDGADRRRDSARRDRDGAVKLSEQQRTTVRERFSRSGLERNRVNNVNFDIRIGASLPRTVTLHTLPPDVVEVVPAYRSYRYVYVRDEIVIVDPGSYAVIAVISRDGRSAAAVRDRRLVLAPADRSYVRQHIDTGAAITLGIGGVSIGMSVPQGLALRPLPSVVVERVPDLRDYRYFVHNDDIVIVDPYTDEIAFVLED